jgi:hypothetical protein
MLRRGETAGTVFDRPANVPAKLAWGGGARPRTPVEAGGNLIDAGLTIK